MSMAFGISSDDVLVVAARRGTPITDEEAERWFEELDASLVEDAALYGNDMDEQTNYALDEIERQLVNLGYLQD